MAIQDSWILLLLVAAVVGVAFNNARIARKNTEVLKDVLEELLTHLDATVTLDTGDDENTIDIQRAEYDIMMSDLKALRQRNEELKAEVARRKDNGDA